MRLVLLLGRRSTGVGISPTVVLCPPFVKLLGMHSKYTVVYYELNRSLLVTLYTSHTIIGSPVDRSRYLTHGRVCPPYVQHLGMHPKYTVVYYELNRSLLVTLYTSHTIIGAPVDQSRYLTHGRVCPPYVQHLGMHPKYTVVNYELNRSLLITLYASHTIIGAPVDQSRYLVQHPQSCSAHRPDYSSVFT